MCFSGWASVFALLAMLVGLPAYAANVTGTELLVECSAAHGSAAHKQCVSYIAGVVDGIDTLLTSLRLMHPFTNAYPRLYCLPPGTAVKGLVVSTVDYLRRHPATRRYGASSEVLLARAAEDLCLHPRCPRREARTAARDR